MTLTSVPQLAPAHLRARAAACLLDTLWVAGPTLLLFVILSSLAGDAADAGDATRAMGLLLVAWLVAAVLLVLSVACWAALLGRGSTPGLKALGLQLVRLDADGGVQEPGFARAFVRAAVFTLGACVLVGPFSPLFDRTGAGRGWHDRVSGTRVSAAGADWQEAEQESEIDSWQPVERLAPPRAPGDPVPAPSRPAVVAAVAAVAVEPVPSADYVPTTRATYTAPPEWQRSPFTLPSDDSDDLDRTRSAHAVPVPSPPAPSAQAPLRWVLRLDTGEAFDVHGDGLIGRNPVGPEGTPCQLIDYADTTKSISKTHLSFGLDNGRLWMTDRRSTNGSSLVRAGSAQRTLSTSVRTFVQPGDLIALGERRIWVAAR